MTRHHPHSLETRPLVVWNAGVSWNATAGTDRHMVTALARYVDILWVDPPVSSVTSRVKRYGASRLPFAELSRISETIQRLSTKTVPLHSRGILRDLSWALVRTQIRRALVTVGRKPAAIIASHIGNVRLRFDQIEPKYVFFGTDDFVGGAALMGVSARRVALDERAQLQRADAVVAVSPMLGDRWRRMGARLLEVIPNGVDACAYRTIDEAAPANVTLEKPVAGLIGHLSERIDIGLLEEVLRAGCSLLLVGPYDPRWEPDRFKALLANPRVHWAGPVSFSELSRYLRVIDVGITPYADTPFNRASFPLKTLEYLAAGKPVVSTPLPAVSWLGTSLITVAYGSEFGAATRTAALESSVELIRQRQDYAAMHSWERRAELFAKFTELVPGCET